MISKEKVRHFSPFTYFIIFMPQLPFFFFFFFFVVGLFDSSLFIYFYLFVLLILLTGKLLPTILFVVEALFEKS